MSMPKASKTEYHHNQSAKSFGTAKVVWINLQDNVDDCTPKSIFICTLSKLFLQNKNWLALFGFLTVSMHHYSSTRQQPILFMFRWVIQTGPTCLKLSWWIFILVHVGPSWHRARGWSGVSARILVGRCNEHRKETLSICQKSVMGQTDRRQVTEPPF